MIILGNLLDRLRSKMGIETLNKMQRKMAGTDAPLTVLLAPTGSGKTVAFAIPMLTSLPAPGGGVNAVVIAPARELVLQIAEVIRRLADGYKTVALYGGHDFAAEARSLGVIPDIVVATPGRLLDHIDRGTVVLEKAATLVLDEYDKALELGFEVEMKWICRKIQGAKRLILTSATRLDTLPEWLPLKDRPVLLDFTSGAGSPATRPDVVWVQSPVRDKLDTLAGLLRALAGDTAIVFVNHRDSAERVYRRLLSEKIPAGLYHGGLEQDKRENAIEMFANGTTPVLVSTDLGSRGLDIDGVAAIIHYHMPPTPESWVHRNGRTARQGASGTVYVITAPAGEENIPECVTRDRDWQPPFVDAASVVWPHNATLYFNLGKKDKISRGDIAGFMIAKGGLAPEEVGRIYLRDHSALVAVPDVKAGRVLASVAVERIKGKKAKISRLA